MHVCFLDPLEDRINEFPGQYLADHQISYANGQPADVPGDTEVLITWSGLVDRSLIDRLPELRLVQRIGFFRGGGDLQAAADRGVAVAVWPHGVLNRVAMHTLMFMVALSRQLLPGHELTIEGVNEIGMEPTFADQRPIAMNWPRVANVDTPANKTLGIVGFGEAGACLAHLAAPLDMEILYYKRTPLSPEQEEFYGVEYAPLDDLLRQSDFVATFVPYSRRERADLRRARIRADEADRLLPEHRPRQHHRRGGADRRARRTTASPAPAWTSSRTSRCRPTTRCRRSRTWC